MGHIKVMIVDDSAFVRQTLTGMLNLDPEISVISTAADPIIAARKMLKEHPDVITLDLEMPRMNGLVFLQKIMTQFPTPVVVISSFSGKGSEMAFKAIEYGAVDVITKPSFISEETFEESRIIICDAIKAAAHAQLKKDRISSANVPLQSWVTPKLSADEILVASPNSLSIKDTPDKIIVIGASTGGTVAIESFLMTMPPDCPGIVIVQHMPELFTRSFAKRLNDICTITVKEGVQGDSITAGKAIIAPGNRHMLVKKNSKGYFIEINDGPLVNRHRPSVDVLFRSAANCAGKNAVGIIMTGMGDDGAKGLLEMREAGAYTIAQSEDTCVVFGMPKVAISINAATAVLPLHEIPDNICRKLHCH